MKLLLFLISFFSLINVSYGQHAIIPEPVNYEQNSSSLKINNELIFIYKESNKELTTYVNQFKSHVANLGIKSPSKGTSNSPIIRISLNKIKNEELGSEGYKLTINDNKIILLANEPAGIFNAFQTLKQLLPSPSSSGQPISQTINISGCTITDYPRFAWRGLMLDVSRHFFTVDEVKQYIDKMAEYKFNVFHWHLTDDNGWRIEIKSLPKLTEVGAWRVERNGRFGENRKKPTQEEKTTYGGFYTQEQIKEVVQYALNRNITIVPEIDVPGHSMAALASYPELTSNKDFKYVSPGDKFAEWYEDKSFKVFTENTLDPSNDKTYEFLDKIFTEVAMLFPGQYIHMGGDECYHGFWDENPNIQKFMKENNLANSEELQSYFVQKVEQIISSKGKKMIGWDEILEGGLADNAAVMSWQGMEGGIKAAKLKHPVVMTPTTFCYLDYSQGDHTVENWIYAKLSLKKTYSFEPVPNGIDPQYILGGQGNLWTEVVPNIQFAFYMTYPRAFSISETLWSPKTKKNWSSFIERTQVHFDRFDISKTNICKAVYEPIVSIYKKDDKTYVKLSNHVPNTEIYYSIDNTYPVNYAIKYSEPFEVPEGELNLRTQTFRNDKAVGRELIISREEILKRIEK